MRPFLLSAALLTVTGVCHAQVGNTLLKKEQIPETIDLLKKGSPKERINAADQLGRRGAVRSSDVKDAVAPLRDLLKNDKDDKVRKAAAEALGNIALELDETIPALVGAMKDDKAMPVQLAAIAALGQMGPEARAAVPELRQLAADKANKKLSGAARKALKSINKKK
jgi:HEAT repeat protein